MKGKEVIEFRRQQGDTIPKVLVRTVQRYQNNKIAYRHKKMGIWQEYTWAQSYEQIKNLAVGLMQLGIQKGEKVFFIGDLEPPLYWSMFGAISMGGVCIPVPAVTRREEVKYLLQHTECVCVIAEDQEQVDKILGMKAEVPNLRKLIYWDPKGLWNYDDNLLISFDQVLEMGRQLEKDRPGVLERRIDEIKEDDLAVFFPTSATTGLPKATMWDHRGLLQSVEDQLRMTPWCEDEEVFSLLVGDFYVAVLPAMVTGTPINLSEKPETLERDRREIAWTAGLIGAIEPVASNIQVRMLNSTALKRFIYRVFLPVGYKIVDSMAREQKPNWYWRALNQIAYAFLFRPLLDKYGYMKARNPVVLGSVQNPETMRLFYAFGVYLRNQYGQNECFPITTNPPKKIDYDTVGVPICNVEIRITAEGEVLARGAARCKGYYRNQEATADLIDNIGWLHSGDAGHFTDDGRLVIVDRVKHLMALSDGTVFAPAWIENKLKFSPYIQQAFITGDGRDSVCALISIDYSVTSDWAERNRIAYNAYIDLSQKEEVYNLILNDIQKRVNNTLPDKTKVKRYALLPKQMDVDDAELTRTGKVRRKYVTEMYKGFIDALYGDKDSFLFESEITYEDGRKAKLRVPVKLVTVKAGEL